MSWITSRSVVKRWPNWVAGGFLICGLALPTGAVDGVVEINQVLAIAGGVTAGDLPGFPVEINDSGSYMLTGNLTTVVVEGAVATTAVQVSANNVTIDLNGFVISGPTTCACGVPPTTTTCLSVGIGNGIAVDSDDVNGLVIFNGQVVGMPNVGVKAGPNARIFDLSVISNANTGVRTGGNSLFERVVSSCNGSFGIFLSGNGTLRAAVVSNNAESGILGGFGTVVMKSSARANGSSGILVASGGAIYDSTASDNGSAGMAAGSGGLLEGNTSTGNAGAGFFVGVDGLASSNKATGNVGEGFTLGAGTGYRGNVASGNSGGTVGGGVSLGPNLCNAVPCP